MAEARQATPRPEFSSLMSSRKINLSLLQPEVKQKAAR
jgi:hypothetical protein